MEIPSEEENSPTTNSTMNNVEDVVFQILLRLPVPSLLRFRCVCKEWCSMINTPLFKDTYLALRRAAAMAVDDDDQVVALISTLVSDLSADLTVRLSSDMDYAISMTCWYGDYQSLAISAWTPSSNEFEISGIHFSMMRIVNHVNGIVCINGMNWDDIFLVNPALRETRKLPIPIFDLDLDLGRFKFHPQAKIGCGYDDSDNEYKVVVIALAFEGDSIFRYIGLVYHLSTNSWKILGDMSAFVSSPYMYAISPESVFSHGSIHWCMHSEIDDPYNRYYYQYRILAFDVSNELFREIKFPRGWRHHDAKLPFLCTIDKSSIALVNCPNSHAASSSSDVQELEVWVMKEYGDSDSWTKRYSIRSSLPRFRSPLSFWKKDKLLLLVDSKLVCYDLFKGQLDEPEHGYRISMPGIQRLQLVTGHESFVSVKQV